MNPQQQAEYEAQMAKKKKALEEYDRQRNAWLQSHPQVANPPTPAPRARDAKSPLEFLLNLLAGRL